MNIITHHGIKGQKWGVQNGPPYPLDYNDHTSAEKRAMKKDARSIQKNLNKQEDIYAKASYSRSENLRKTQKFFDKNDKQKAEKYLAKALTDQETMKRCESATWKLIGSALDNGYGLQSKLVIRDGRTWYQQANESGLTGAIGTQVRVSTGRQANPMIITNQWKVSAGNDALKSKNGLIVASDNKAVSKNSNNGSSQTKSTKNDTNIISKAAAKAESDFKKPGGILEKYRAVEADPVKRESLVSTERARVEKAWDKAKADYKAGKISREEAIEKDVYYESLFKYINWV